MFVTSYLRIALFSLLSRTDYSNKRDVGDQPGTQWTLSSHKPGYGIDQLRDPDLNKLWQ